MKKKYYLFIALSLFAIIKINGQDSLLVDPAKIDSLHELIESHTNADKEKVRLLNEYAHLCFYNAEYKEGLIATREARELSEKIKYDGGLVMYHRTLQLFIPGGGGGGGIGGNSLSQYHRMAASMIAAQSGNNALFQIMDIPVDYPGRFTEEKLKKLQATLDYFTELGDKEIQASILYSISIYYLPNNQNQPDKRDQLLDQFIALYKSMNEIDPVLLGYDHKLLIALSAKNQSGIDSVVREITSFVSQVRDEEITASTNFQLAFISQALQQYSSAIGYLTKSLDSFEKTGNIEGQGLVYNRMTEIYNQLEMHSYRADIFERFRPILKESGITNNVFGLYYTAIWANYNAKRYDKAWEYLNFIVDSLLSLDGNGPYLMNAQRKQLEGQILMDEGKYREAIPLLKKANDEYFEYQLNLSGLVTWASAHIANCYYQLKEYQPAIDYINLCRSYMGPNSEDRLVLKINLQLANIYEALHQKDSAYKYLRKYQDLMEESNRLADGNQILALQINSTIDKSKEQISQLEQARLLQEQKSKNQQLLIFSITGALLSALLILFILFRNNKSKQKANTVLEKTLSNLKSTQSQLIQSEKMASLGELTAGIAHEIQNPLNFVNNFSDVNTELLTEMKEEIDKGNFDQAKEIADDAIKNQKKINHHGQRADAIVKGMLQHSMSGSGHKEPTDINALCDEYLRLSYHGLRAKDKSFNATMKTDFDKTMGNINIIPQDIGRVVLNLINNAFYVVEEKKKQNPNGYEPTVSVSTKKVNGKVEIKVADNGNGIPQKVLDKIFQPFFTTKPTGSGTGLGLSLSYDIIKAHGGEIKVETKEGEGTEFSIQLPVV